MSLHKRGYTGAPSVMTTVLLASFVFEETSEKALHSNKLLTNSSYRNKLKLSEHHAGQHQTSVKVQGTMPPRHGLLKNGASACAVFNPLAHTSTFLRQVLGIQNVNCV